MKKVLALVLALVLVLSLAACGGSSIIGKWVSDYELKPIYDSKVDSSIKSSESKLLSTIYENLRSSYENITIKEIFQINNDNTFKLYFDTGNAKKTMDERISEIVTKTIKEDKFGSRLGDEAVNTLINDIKNNMDLEKVFSNKVEGNCKIDGNKFYFDKDDTSTYAVFSMKGDILSFSDVTGSFSEMEQSLNLLIREFKKESSTGK